MTLYITYRFKVHNMFIHLWVQAHPSITIFWSVYVGLFVFYVYKVTETLQAILLDHLVNKYRIQMITFENYCIPLLKLFLYYNLCKVLHLLTEFEVPRDIITLVIQLLILCYMFWLFKWLIVYWWIVFYACVACHSGL